MIRVIQARLQQKYRTIKYPDGPNPPLPGRFRGKPVIDGSKCGSGCTSCADACPTGALIFNGSPRVDLGKCLFCTDCAEACPGNALSFCSDYRLSSGNRENLVVSTDADAGTIAIKLNAAIKKLFGRSLKLRQVSAGGCNACEADINVLSTVGWDLGRFGIQFVASPRHADGIVVTGPVTQNMKLALEKTYNATPAPKIVIAVGSCAISGGTFAGNDEVCDGVGKLFPVDLYVPGCPPHPLTILDGLLRLIGKIE